MPMNNGGGAKKTFCFDVKKKRDNIWILKRKRKKAKGIPAKKVGSFTIA